MTDATALSRNREQIVAELDALYEKATPGTWLLYTSNSWRRIGTKFDYREIIYPMRHRSDGHPDLGGPNLDHDLAFLLALKEAWPEIRTLLASSEMKFSKGELEALIDYHDFNDAAAEAVDMTEASLHHAKRSAHFAGLRDALVREQEQKDKKTLNRMLASGEMG